MRQGNSLVQFVRGLAAGQVGAVSGERFVLPSGRSAGVAAVRNLQAAGVLDGDKSVCRANAGTATWLKRAMIDGDAFRAQHQVHRQQVGRATTDLAESPLTRLMTAASPFLEPHHLEAGEKVRLLVEKANLRPRMTTNYDGAGKVAGTRNALLEVSDLAADARRAVAEIHADLPADCAGVVIDVCGWLKGLQEVERERGWPRRSAKLVLRIGLDQLAAKYRMGPYGTNGTRRSRSWLSEGARPDVFG